MSPNSRRVNVLDKHKMFAHGEGHADVLDKHKTYFFL